MRLSDNMSWYKGPTLLQEFGKLNQPRGLEKLPRRFQIADVYKIGGIGTVPVGGIGTVPVGGIGTVPVGRIETEVLKTGTNILFALSGKSRFCKSFEWNHWPIGQALPGFNMGLNI